MPAGRAVAQFFFFLRGLKCLKKIHTLTNMCCWYKAGWIGARMFTPKSDSTVQNQRIQPLFASLPVSHTSSLCSSITAHSSTGMLEAEIPPCTDTFWIINNLLFIQTYTSDLLTLGTCWLEINYNRNGPSEKRTFMQSDEDVSEVCGSVRMM